MKDIKKEILDLEADIQAKQKKLESLKEITKVEDTLVKLNYLELADKIKKKFKEAYPQEILQYSYDISKDVLYLFIENNSIQDTSVKIPLDFIVNLYSRKIESRLDRYNISYYVLSRR